MAQQRAAGAPVPAGQQGAGWEGEEEEGELLLLLLLLLLQASAQQRAAVAQHLGGGKTFKPQGRRMSLR